MQRSSSSFPRRAVGIACVVFFFSPVLVHATDYYIDGQQEETIDQPGELIGMYNYSQGTGTIYKGPDQFDTSGSYFSYAAALDTGSSGCVLATLTAQGRTTLSPGETYQDVGIGGAETFNVSQPVGVMWSSVYNAGDSENTAHFSANPNAIKFQVRTSDPVISVEGESDTVYINTIGTPVLNNYTMHVQTNGSTFSYYVDGGIDFLGIPFPAMPVNYLQTDLLPSAPSGLNVRPGGSELVLLQTGSSTPLHVPLVYTNFVTGSPTVSTASNPTIPGVTMTVTTGGTPSGVGSWLLDSGAAVTMIGHTLASSLGLLDEASVAQTTILGIGGSTQTIYGYPVHNLSVPLTDGGHLIFEDIVVFVPSGDLPAGLAGIFGMNLLDNAFAGGDLDTTLPSAFSDWYVIPPAQSVPEPATLVLLAAGLAMFWLRRTVVRRRA